jgi:sec-independent protein translocase protein TatA
MTTSPAEEDRGMIGDLFDSPWKIAIIAVVIIVLFGSKKLPHAARSLGQSMRILKREVQSLHEDEPVAPVTAALGAGGEQVQIDALQQQIRDL